MTKTENTLESSDLPHINDVTSLSSSEIKSLYQRLSGRSLPGYSRRGLLTENIIWMLQVIESGKDPRKFRADLLKKANSISVSDKVQYLPGTRLVREWNGITHEVIIEEKGYRWLNKHYRSLTRIAEEITGAHWSGPRFFGLKTVSKSKCNRRM